MIAHPLVIQSCSYPRCWTASCSDVCPALREPIPPSLLSWRCRSLCPQASADSSFLGTPRTEMVTGMRQTTQTTRIHSNYIIISKLLGTTQLLVYNETGDVSYKIFILSHKTCYCPVRTASFWIDNRVVIFMWLWTQNNFVPQKLCHTKQHGGHQVLIINSCWYMW